MINLWKNPGLAALTMLFMMISCSTLPSEQRLPSTISPTQISSRIEELYSNNGGCKLPCLLGIVPGQTSIRDVYSQFSGIGDFEDQTRIVDHYQTIAFTSKLPPNGFTKSSGDNRWGFSLRVKDNIVAGLLTGATDIKNFAAPSLSSFLMHFGQPEEIWMRVIESQVINENPDYEIALYYPSKGIFIRWRGGANAVLSQTEKDISLTACPQHLPVDSETSKGFYPPFFYLFPPNQEIPFEEIIKVHLTEDPSGSYQPLSGADLQEFYTMYLEETTQDCFPLSYSW